MKKIFSLILCAFFAALTLSVASAPAQSGRKIARSPTQPDPPVQAPVWSPPEPEAAPKRERPTPGELRALPDSLLQRPLRSLDESSFRLADFGGKVVVVNLWATWCGPCRREIPEYEKVRKEFAGRAVEFVALTTEDPRTSTERVKKFVRSFNFGFRLGWADPETAQTLMNGRGAIPQTFVIAADGRIVSHWVGYAQGRGGDHLRETIAGALVRESEAGGK